MTNKEALEKARVLCKPGSATCRSCGGKGYIEVHEPGHTHYETDDECPAYHFRRVSCTCSRHKEIAAELLRAYADGVIAGQPMYGKVAVAEYKDIRAEADKLERGE